MNVVDVTLKLPEELVEKARAAGLLTDERVGEWLRTELERQRRVNRLFETIDQLAVLEPALTQEEIDAELRADKAEKAAKRDKNFGQSS
jgi:hypothetical protein